MGAETRGGARVRQLSTAIVSAFFTACIVGVIAIVGRGIVKMLEALP